MPRRNILPELLLIITLLLSSVARAQDAAPTPVELTAEQDHQRMMDLLDIERLRPGRNGLDPTAPNYANYDEAASNPYPDLPDLLVMNNGKKVAKAKSWTKKRRAEIIELFDREIYGRAPEATPAVDWEVVSEKEAMVGKTPAIVRELVGHVDNSAYPAVNVDIAMTLTLPKQRSGPVPAIVSFTFRWPPNRPRPPLPPGPTPQEQILARGWAHAELIPTTVQADNGAGLTHGIIGLMNKGQPRGPEDWGALRAWAWGASRALDYFGTIDDIDETRIAIEGLSRYGKAVAVTMAYDQRFAIGFCGSAGEAGASLYRRDNGETVENIASSGEYHWMAGNFLKYAGPLTWDDLPIDAHSLIALSAPRPLFVGTGTAEAGDAWVDPKGTFMAVVAASPVYDLLGAKGLDTDQYPGPGVSLTDGDLAFRQHHGGHTNWPNWPYFLDFAARYFEKG